LRDRSIRTSTIRSRIVSRRAFFPSPEDVSYTAIFAGFCATSRDAVAIANIARIATRTQLCDRPRRAMR